MPKRITKEAEEKILRGAEKMIDLVENGSSPDAALTKVAESDDYTPGHIRLMAQAFNTGKVNYHRKSSNALLDKIASFPLADSSYAISKLYPDHVKSAATVYRTEAVSEEYSSPPSFLKEAEHMEKVAFALPPMVSGYIPIPRDTDRLHARAYSLVNALEKEKEEKRALASHARDKFAKAIKDLDYYFELSGRPTSYPVTYENASLLWGKQAESLLKAAAIVNSSLSKEASFDHYKGQVDLKREPYSSISSAIKLAEEYKEAKDEYEDYSKKALEATQKLATGIAPIMPVHAVAQQSAMANQPSAPGTTGSLMRGSAGLTPPSDAESMVGSSATPTPPAPAPAMAKGGSLLKQAAGGFFSDVAHMTGIGAIAHQLKPKEDAGLKNKAYDELTDPAHEARLRKIRVQAVLHDMLANDPYISAEHPEKVTDLFNKVTHLAPTAAEQPLLMQSVLRRYLAQGQTDPHDLDQLVGIESELHKQNEPPYSGPSYSPGKPTRPE
jgi:hypothetical protein